MRGSKAKRLRTAKRPNPGRKHGGYWKGYAPHHLRRGDVPPPKITKQEVTP